MKIALVLTAAGSSSRFGGDKLAYPIDGKPMLLHALELSEKDPPIPEPQIPCTYMTDHDEIMEWFGAADAKEAE